MATPQLSPSTCHTVVPNSRRTDGSTLDNIGAIAGPFKIKPLTKIDVSTSKNLSTGWVYASQNHSTSIG